MAREMKDLNEQSEEDQQHLGDLQDEFDRLQSKLKIYARVFHVFFWKISKI